MSLEPLNKKSKHKFRIVVAIDFGTDGTALSFANKETNEVYPRRKWNEKHQTDNEDRIGEKLKTNILLKRELIDEKEIDNDTINNEYQNRDNKYKYSLVEFGNKATYNYIRKKVFKDSENWLYFEKFKMALYEPSKNRSKKVHIKKYLTSLCGVKVDTKIVFVEAFKYIKEQALNEMKSHDFTLINGLNDIQWVVTVPAIWSDESKAYMHQWMIYAGMIDNNNKSSDAPSANDQIIIEYEPDCASASIQASIKEEKNKASKFGYFLNWALSNKKSKVGERYILLDMGGGTVDVACHEIVDEYYGVKEIYRPTGGDWGSALINTKFQDILVELFGKETIKKLKDQKSELYLDLLENFESSKCQFFRRNWKNDKLKNVNKNSEHDILLSDDLIDYLEDDMKIDIEKKVNNFEFIDDVKTNLNSRPNKGEKGLIKYNNGKIFIKYKIWKYLFDKSINHIIKHIKHLLDYKLNNISYLCLVGGFSSSKYVQYKLFKTFKSGFNNKYNLKMIIPKSPLLSVVDGASRLGLVPDYVKSRVMKATYGTSIAVRVGWCRSEGISQDHINSNLCGLFGGEKNYVNNIFEKYVEIGQSIERFHKVRKQITYDKSSGNEIPIHSFQEKTPKITTGSKPIAKLMIPETIEHKQKFDVVLCFGYTKIRAYITKLNDKNVESEIDIKYKV